MRHLLHKNENDNSLITTITHSQNFDTVQEKLGGVEIQDINSIDISFLDAYKIKSHKMVLDLEKAREIKVNKIRQERNQVFTLFDKKYDIALKDYAPEELMKDLKKERQNLKDAPHNAEVYLDSCITLDEIRSLSLKQVM